MRRRRPSAHLSDFGGDHKPINVYMTKYVMHSLRNGPTVTFPTTVRTRRLLDASKLHCMLCKAISRRLTQFAAVAATSRPHPPVGFLTFNVVRLLKLITV